MQDIENNPNITLLARQIAAELSRNQGALMTVTTNQGLPAGALMTVTTNQSLPACSTLMPPNGWGCKCRVRQLNDRQAEDKGGETIEPAPVTIESPGRDGEPVAHPKGVDPEWSYNPGAEPRRTS